MTISELRTLFTSRSGDINMADADIDRYINSGIELLDLLTDYSHAPAKYYAEIATGDSFHTFGNKSRVIKEVWIIDSVDGRSKLEKVKLSDLREYYPDITTTAAGKPKYYAVDINRAVPTGFDETTLPAAFQPFIDVSVPAYALKGILFGIPTDETYVVEVIGKFHSPTLSDTYTQNWWSVNYPDVAILAAMYQLEAHYRNTEGMNDYMNAMKPILKGIDYDAAEEDGEEFTAMRG